MVSEKLTDTKCHIMENIPSKQKNPESATTPQPNKTKSRYSRLSMRH